MCSFSTTAGSVKEAHMLKINRHRSLAMFLFSLFCFGLPSVSSATNSWGGYHWARQANPLFLSLGDNLSGTWKQSSTDINSKTDYLYWTASAWNGTDNPYYDLTSSSFVSLSLNPVISLSLVVPGGSISNPRKCFPTTGRVEVCNYKYGRNRWLGVAQIWVSSLHISQGTVKLNDTYFDTTTYNTPAWRKLVICQEVGHTFGLDHQNESFGNPNLGTCMDYTSNPSGPPANVKPNTHDFDEIAIVYNHGDTFNSSSGPGPITNPARLPAGLDLNEPSHWGALIRQSHGGRTAVYELNLGAGRKIVTHVIWAE